MHGALETAVRCFWVNEGKVAPVKFCTSLPLAFRLFLGEVGVEANINVLIFP